MSVHVCQKLFCSGAYAGIIGANQILAIVSEIFAAVCLLFQRLLPTFKHNETPAEQHSILCRANLSAIVP